VTEYAFRDAQGEQKAPWGAVIEPSSTEKGRGYATNYRDYIQARTGRVLGSYAFHWDPSGSQTASFHAMHLKTGERLGAVDELAWAWTGRAPSNRAPEVLAVDGPRYVSVPRGGALRLRLTATDPEGDPLAYSFEMVDEGAPRFVGDHEQPLPVVASGKLSGPAYMGKAPEKPGVYRLFLFVKDGKGGAAVANVPVRVETP